MDNKTLAREKVRILQDTLDNLTEFEKIRYVIVTFDGWHININSGQPRVECLPNHATKLSLDDAKSQINNLMNKGFTWPIIKTYQEALQNSLETANLNLLQFS